MWCVWFVWLWVFCLFFCWLVFNTTFLLVMYSFCINEKTEIMGGKKEWKRLFFQFQFITRGGNKRWFSTCWEKGENSTCNHKFRMFEFCCYYIYRPVSALQCVWKHLWKSYFLRPMSVIFHWVLFSTFSFLVNCYWTDTTSQLWQSTSVNLKISS